MQIIDIEEPDTSNKKKTQELVVGIDFGTTNSLIAVANDAVAKSFKTESGNDLLPSIVSRRTHTNNAADDWIVGLSDKQSSAVRSIKRLLAKEYDEITNTPVLSSLLENSQLALKDERTSIAFGTKSGEHYSIPAIASRIFRSLKNSVYAQAGCSESDSLKAVVSVPAYFNETERGQVMLAAKYAGIEVLRLIPEPTAAAYAYGLQQKAEGSYLVYDLGGGTFDVSILNMNQGVLQVVACGGDNNLGGDDIDYAIAEYIVSKHNAAQKESIDITHRLISQAKNLKESLSYDAIATISLAGVEYQISQQDIGKVIGEIIDKTIKIARDVYFDAERLELDGIILVGGSTRIPVIRSKLQKEFSAKIFDSIDPDRAVVYGAALQAENLATNKGNLLIDVVPLSVGIELYGGLSEKIIMRNTPLPFSITREFTTQADYQTGMKFHVLQGEREMSVDCRSLAHFELTDLSPAKAGGVKVAVTFAMDADGILSIAAKEVTKEIELAKAINIVLKPSYGLTDKQIETDLENAFSHASNDHELRLMAETKMDAEELIGGLRVALAQTPDIISDVEYNEINDRIDALEISINNADSSRRNEILQKTQELNKYAAHFIEKHLNMGADQIIVGKNIKDLGN